MSILSTLNLSVKTESKSEVKIPKYNRAIYGSLPTQKSEYNEGVGCDIYVSGSIVHFQTGKKHGEYSKGYKTQEEAMKVIIAMAKLQVPGIWDIAQNIETKLYEIVPAPRYSKK